VPLQPRDHARRSPCSAPRGHRRLTRRALDRGDLAAELQKIYVRATATVSGLGTPSS
jgi:hypothetical protein